MPDYVVTMRFEYGDASADELKAEALAVLDEARSLSDRKDNSAPIAIDIREEGQGFEPITTIVVTIVAQLGIHVARKTWDEVIWPHLQEKFGIDALGKKKKDTSEDDGESTGDE